MNIGDTITATVQIPADVIPSEITVNFVRPNGTVAATRTLSGGGVVHISQGSGATPSIYEALYNTDTSGTWKARGKIESGNAQSNPVDEFYVNRV